MSTLVVLREKVADRLNLRVPVNASGSVTAVPADRTTSAFIDDAIVEPDRSLRGAWVHFLTGANAGTFRQVASNQDGLISLTRPFASAIAVSDTYDLFRKFSPAQINAAINWPLNHSLPYLYTHFEQEVQENPTTNEYSYPSGLFQLRQLRRRNNPVSITATPPANIGALMSLAAALTRGVTYTQISVTGDQRANISNGSIFQIDYGFGDAVTVVTSPGGVITYDGTNTNIPVVTPTQSSSVPSGNPNLPFVSTADFPVTTPVQTLATAAIPPNYDDLRGELWEDLGMRVRLRYRPAAGQFLLFVGYGLFPNLVNDTDQTLQQYPDELVITGAKHYLYQLLFATEAGSSALWLSQAAKDAKETWTQQLREYAMPQIEWETHPPVIRIVRGTIADLGPVNP